MSLEQVIIENTNAIKLLIATLTKSETVIPVSEQNQSVTTEQPAQKSIENTADPEHPKHLKDKPKVLKTEPETEPTWTTCDVKIPHIEDVVRALLTLSKKDRDSAVAILTRFKSKHAREVPEEARAEFLHAVREKIAVLEGLKDVKL